MYNRGAISCLEIKKHMFTFITIHKACSWFAEIGPYQQKKPIKMKIEPIKISICSSEEESWNTIWKWTWFVKETWKSNFREEGNPPALHSLFSRLQVRSILDCSCGLGFKTISLAEMGFEVEGSDASAVAIKYAPQLAREEGLNIKFFRSCWEELGKRCKRKFDCVFSDAFDWISTRESLLASAKGIYSILDESGKFVFGVPIAGPKNTEKELKKFMNEQWNKQQRFEILPSYEKNGTRLTHLIVYDETSNGILENNIYLIEEQGVMRAEIAFMMDLCKWTWKDYTKVLREAGFREVYGLEEKGIEFNIGVK